MNVPLYAAIDKALGHRVQLGVPIKGLTEFTASAAPDLFSNDYLSMKSDAHLRSTILETLSKCPDILGAGGARLLGGNSPMHRQFEERMMEVFKAPDALLFNSGYDANVALLGALPQKSDVIVFDELVHASARDGIEASRAKGGKHAFAHNSLASLESTLKMIVEQNRNISERPATVFVVVETLYSMDGDFSPLREIVSLVEQIIPEGCYHIVVDEAHSTGIYGERGRGIVAMLGLESRVQTVLHTFGKARGFYGAVLLSSPPVIKFLINYARPFIFSTALPLMHLVALNATFDLILSPIGQSRIERLQHLCAYFETRLLHSLEQVPKGLLRFTPNKVPKGYPAHCRSPIFPIHTSMPLDLANYLKSLGYACQSIHTPVVPKGEERIRVIMHAANTESELEDLINHLLTWAETARSLQVGMDTASLKLSKL